MKIKKHFIWTGTETQKQQLYNLLYEKGWVECGEKFFNNLFDPFIPLNHKMRFNGNTITLLILFARMMGVLIKPNDRFKAILRLYFIDKTGREFSLGSLNVQFHNGIGAKNLNEIQSLIREILRNH